MSVVGDSFDDHLEEVRERLDPEGAAELERMEQYFERVSKQIELELAGSLAVQRMPRLYGWRTVTTAGSHES